MTLGERIRAAREAKSLSMTELARRIGVSRQAVSDWEADKSIPRKGKLLALAKELDVPVESLELFGSGTSVTLLEKSGFRKVVLLIQWSDLRLLKQGAIPVGALQKPEYIEVDIDISSSAVAVRLEDASMEPAFRKGDVVIVDPEIHPQKHDFVLVRLAAGGKHLFREYIPRANGAFDLRAENPEWGTLTINKAMPAQVLGVMVEHRRKRHIPE